MRIFGKQLFLYLGTLVISFGFLGLVLSQGLRGFLIGQRSDELTGLVRRVVYSMENFSEQGMFILPVQEVRNVHSYTDATVIILDAEFNVFVAYGLPVGAVARIYEVELAPVMVGETVVVTSNHPALEPLLVVGAPFWLDGEIAGAVLIGASMAELDSAISEMYRIMFVAMVVSAVLAFVLIYISSTTISRPLRQINEAAGVIAGGDFDKRIPVRGNDEVSRLAIQFNKMAESLQEQDRIRNAFIANLSHDIRSPLTSMRGFLTAIADGTVSADEQPYYLGIILDESERLIKLSNDILDIQRIQDSEVALHKSVFDINDLIRKTILGFSRRALEKRLMVTSRFAHPADMVEADEGKIRRALYNLIDNAVKFTQEDGEITIETTTTKNKVSVSVSDNGRGMTAEEQKYIFDRFYKGDHSRGQDKKGSGLGLSIVKGFIRAHGEKLTVESSTETGSVFTFTLPSKSKPT
ncbi:MAG: HAMP domain-containing histidine kinase [Defluviitaleaceae bacterium]|nr:HAMP domain-containing histidine kinase [Defluviitaleaceae bacterium]